MDKATLTGLDKASLKLQFYKPLSGNNVLGQFTTNIGR